MNKIKNKIFFIIKIILAIILFLILILFFYSAFFYEKQFVENETTKNQETTNVEEKIKQEENKIQPQEETDEPENEIEQKEPEIIPTAIKDALFMTVGNKPITNSDVVNEIKLLLILNNESYSNEKRQMLQDMAVNSIVKRNIKQIELDKNNFFKFSEKDLEQELARLANNIDMDLETLKNIFASNELDFSILIDQIKNELYWNSLIFQLYKNRININQEEIDEKLKLIQNNINITKEYLISEILISLPEEDNLQYEIEKLIKKIEEIGFEDTAKNVSISESALKGGDLGWLKEDIISTKVKPAIINTSIGNLSKPLILPEGILIFKIRDKREIKNSTNLEEAKDQLVYSEKAKILQMYSFSHYDKLRRSATVKFYNE